MIIERHNFTDAFAHLKHHMVRQGHVVETETWQGVPIMGRPDMITTELLNVTVSVPLLGMTDLDHWRADIKPNLPWADDHFEERVGGQPLNPPPSWAWWPWAGSAAKHRNREQKFNHTYPERYWPKNAGEDVRAAQGHVGIRGEYGDLRDVVTLLTQQPHTRQAVLPIFFPEDTGIGDGGRKPCTLAYQFIRRGSSMHVVYFMRSCDLVRHYSDDVYLTVRLLLWMLAQTGWTRTYPGTFTMHITSLHVFANDVIALRKELGCA